jgi:DNA replication licensing factor MCM7
LVKRIENHAHRYEDLFYKAINAILSENFPMVDSAEPVDIILKQRMEMARQNEENADPDKMFPQKLLKRYAVNFKPSSSAKPLAVREAKSAAIGHLVSIRGSMLSLLTCKEWLLVS